MLEGAKRTKAPMIPRTTAVGIMGLAVCIAERFPFVCGQKNENSSILALSDKLSGGIRENFQ
jgi:hypothetical protein